MLPQVAGKRASVRHDQITMGASELLLDVICFYMLLEVLHAIVFVFTKVARIANAVVFL